MPRWTSVVTAALAAVVAAPIGGHYLAPKDTPGVIVTNERQAGGAGTRLLPAAVPSLQKDPKTMAQTRQDGEQAAVEEGRQDIASLMCAHTQQPTDQDCRPPEGFSEARVIIATVPDPVHTHLALRFDREMDTLEDSLRQLGWVYDRSWLPWDNTVRKAPDRWDARAFDTAAQDALEALPGVLLFRHGMKSGSIDGSPSVQTLIVLLVAEKPTSGINAEQFRNAIAFWRKPSTLFRSGAGTAPPHELSILGPTFSGSLFSLYGLLDNTFSVKDKDCTAVPISISSGSVSDGRDLRALTALTPCGSKGLVTASSFLPNANDREQQLLCFISIHHPDVTVAEISEKESAFGSLTSADAARAQAPGPKRPAPCLTQNYQVLHLPFPREVSQLRKAYDKSGVVGFTGSSDTPHTGLQLSTADDEHEGDTISSFAGAAGTVGIEAQMASIARALTVNHAAIAVISATDAMDEIFVAHYLSQHSPNVTAVVQDSDQLFLHQEANSSLANVYIASPWPLSEENEAWTPSANAPLKTTFPSASDQGIFLALHTLVCKTDTSGVCASELPGSRSPLAVNANANANERWSPPLWLSVVEHGHFVPVAWLSSTSSTEWTLPGTFSRANHTQSIVETRTDVASKLLATLIVLLLGWHAWACSQCGITRSFAWTYADADQEHHRIRLLVKAALALTGSFALAFLYVVGGSTIRVQYLPFWIYLALGQAVGVYASSQSIYKLLVGEGSFKTRFTVGMYAVMCTALLALADIFLLPMLAPSSTGEKSLFLYRASMPLSGASPTIPLLLMVAAFAAILHGMFARLAFYGHRIPRLPAGFDGLRCPSSSSVQDLTDLLSKWEWKSSKWKAASSTTFEGASVSRTATWRVWALVFCVFIMSGAFLIPDQHSIVSLPHGGFDRMMTFFAIATGAFILQNLMVAAKAWRLLKHKILIPLKQSPLRWGFTWIKGFSWKRIWTSSRNLSSNQIFGYLNRLLQTSSRSPWGGKNPHYYKPVCDLYMAAEHQAPVKNFTDGMVKLHKQMQEEAEGKLRDLEYRWQKDRGPITGASEIRGVPMLYEVRDLKEDPREDVLRRMGDEEFVALLYLGYITMILIQIRQRMLTAALLFMLLLLSLTAYPWMYRQTILLLMVALFLALAGTTLHIYSEMHRDDILSRTTETEPGKLDGGFFEKVIPVLGIPLITLIATQFPEVSNFLFSWVQPGLSKF